MIEGAELIVYSTQGEQFCLPLSEAQVVGIITILGLKDIEKGKCTCYSDETVLKLAKKFKVEHF